MSNEEEEKEDVREKTKASGGDTIVLLGELPQYHLCKGDEGIVVEVHTELGEGYDIEFIGETGHTKGLACAVKPEQIAVIWSCDQRQPVQAEQPVV
jgi:hypothetical protein